MAGSDDGNAGGIGDEACDGSDGDEAGNKATGVKASAGDMGLKAEAKVVMVSMMPMAEAAVVVTEAGCVAEMASELR